MHLIFSILFLLSIIRLWSDPMGNRLWGGILWLATFFLFIRILKKNGYLNLPFLKETIKAEPLLTGTICLAITGILLSAIVNLPSICQTGPLAVVLMVSTLACYSFCIMVFIVFHLTRTSKFLMAALSMMAAVHLLALLEIPLYPWVREILRHTLGHLYLYPGYIHSVFRGTTIYGPLAALTAVGLGLCAIKAPGNRPFLRFAQGLTSILATAGCLVCPSRTGLLGLFTGLILSLLFVPRKIRIAGLFLILVFVAGIHFAAYENQFMRCRLAKSMPYFSKIRKPSTMTLRDFQVHLKCFRLKLDKRAVALWKTSPWLGIGPGQFNIKSGFKWQFSAHNLYLSILCENGLISFIPLCLLFLWTLKKFWGSITGILISMLGVMWCFEIFIEHSMSFILGGAWLLVWTNYAVNPAALNGEIKKLWM